MKPTIFRENLVRDETQPIISNILTYIFISLSIAFTVIYTIQWSKPISDTKLISTVGTCSPILFECIGCRNMGCTLTGTGKMTLSSNQINITSFSYIPSNSTRIVYLCAGSNEWLILGQNSVDVGQCYKEYNYYGYCSNDPHYHPGCEPIPSIRDTLIGRLEISSGVWIDIFSELSNNNPAKTQALVEGKEYSVWVTKQLNSDKIIRSYTKTFVFSSAVQCFSGSNPEHSSYKCSAFHLSSMSWQENESLPNIFSLIGVIGGFIGIFYKCMFGIMWCIRRILMKLFSQESSVSINQKESSLNETEPVPFSIISS